MAKRKPEKTGDDVIDAIAIWRYQNCPALSIDVILSRPLDALKMGVAVDHKIGNTSDGEAERFNGTLQLLLTNYPDLLDRIDGVCRAALHARKKGQLKRDKA